MSNRRLLRVVLALYVIALLAVVFWSHGHDEPAGAVAPTSTTSTAPTTTASTTSTTEATTTTTIEVQAAAAAPPATYRVTTTTEPEAASTPAYASMEPCGGDLPPCYVKWRESHGDYTALNSSSGASGAWQFIDSTWAGYAGYSKAMYAPPEVQDAKAREVWAGGAGCSHWSAC
jgi:cytoskeletal protein RodZ